MFLIGIGKNSVGCIVDQLLYIVIQPNTTTCIVIMYQLKWSTE
jgi:hypothetical protein